MVSSSEQIWSPFRRARVGSKLLSSWVPERRASSLLLPRLIPFSCIYAIYYQYSVGIWRFASSGHLGIRNTQVSGSFLYVQTFVAQSSLFVFELSVRWSPFEGLSGFGPFYEMILL